MIIYIHRMVRFQIDSVCVAVSISHVATSFSSPYLPVFCLCLSVSLLLSQSFTLIQVSEMVVYLLRRLGSRAIERAIEFIDDHADAVGERLHDFLLSLLQDALAEISYVRQVGYAQAIASISRGKA